jgi:effector-binding domain-containing protein
MNKIGGLSVIAVSLIIGATGSTAEEEAKYAVALRDGRFEIRDYEPQIVAEVVVGGTLLEADDMAFGRLFRYISGRNRSTAKIPMTAPVSQEPRSEKIEMTAPVGLQRADGGWAVSFVMPASYTMESLPAPDDPGIKLRQVPAARVAAIRYSGFWSEKGYLRNKEALQSWIKEKGFAIAGEPVWARYNPPWTLWFMRRNEILIPVRE